MIKAPNFLSMLAPENRNQWLGQLSRLMSPLNELQEQVHTTLHSFYASSKPKHLDKTILGSAVNKWSASTEHQLLDSYPEYLKYKGTKKGLKILTESLLKTNRFIIIERSFPYREALMNDDLKLDSQVRLSQLNHAKSAITIRFEFERENLEESQIESFYQCLRSELEPHLLVYLEFEETPEPAQEQQDYYLLVGDRIS